MELQEIQEILNTWNLFYKRILEFEEKKNIHETIPANKYSLYKLLTSEL